MHGEARASFGFSQKRAMMRPRTAPSTQRPYERRKNIGASCHHGGANHQQVICKCTGGCQSGAAAATGLEKYRDPVSSVVHGLGVHNMSRTSPSDRASLVIDHR